MLQPLLTLHSQKLLLCGPTRVHLRGRLRERGENDSMRANSRLRLISGPQGEEIISGGSWSKAEWIKTEKGDKLKKDLTWRKVNTGREQKRGSRKDVKERLTSIGLKVSTPSIMLCFKMLLFCLIDWTWEKKVGGGGDKNTKFIFWRVALMLFTKHRLG